MKCSSDVLIYRNIKKINNKNIFFLKIRSKLKVINKIITQGQVSHINIHIYICILNTNTANICLSKANNTITIDIENIKRVSFFIVFSFIVYKVLYNMIDKRILLTIFSLSHSYSFIWFFQ